MGTDIEPLICDIEEVVASHSLGPPGHYARWLWQDTDGRRDLGMNPYGCADAANILYTVGRFPDGSERASWVSTLQGLQDRGSGFFREATHDPIHTTAHCLGAIELFDARPRHRLSGLADLRETDQLKRWLEGLDWSWNPWGSSHKGAGVYAGLVLAGEANADWEDCYFDWLWNEADPETGLWRRGCIASGGAEMLFHHLAGSFHYLFNHEYARRPLRYPTRMVDTCLRILDEGLFPPLGRTTGFAELDWVYCLSRSTRQCGHRLSESRRALAEFAEAYLVYLRQLDPRRDDGLNDLHQLLGVVSALAELQQAVPGLLRTARPLRLVLDRRPFV